MAAQRGKDILVKLRAEDDVYRTVAGLRATRIALRSGMADVTTLESPGRWRELLTGVGTQSASVSGDGVFRDAASDAALRYAFFAGEAPELELVIPDFGVVSGRFQITSLEYSGQHDAEARFEIGLESAGTLSFVEI